MSAWKWFPRLAGGMAGVIPGADDALLFTSRGQAVLTKYPQFAWGVRNLAGPIGIATKVHAVDQSNKLLGGASNRMLHVITGGRYDAGSAWDTSPKARWDSRSDYHTHGYFVSPTSRVERNPSQGRWDVVQQDYARGGVVWMP